MNQTLSFARFSQRTLAGCTLTALLALVANSAQALDLEGFLEPYRTIEVAADESGTIEEVFVREGDYVKAGQPLLRLNSDVHEASLAIAQQNMEAVGRIEAAAADLQMRQLRLEKLRALREEGHARQEEVDRAAGEVAVAQANLLAAQEEQATRRLEFAKIKAQLARRTVRAPIAGSLTHQHKVAGEFVAPNSPEVLTLVQIDTLLANFTLTSTQSGSLHDDQEVKLYFVEGSRETTGRIEYISPIIDAESGTVLVKIRIDNAQGDFRSGERCLLQLEQ